MKKPDRRVFELTMEQLGVEAGDCVYIDDRRKNLGAAQALGMDAVLFNSRNVEYEGKTVTNLRALWKFGSMQDLRKVAIAMLSGGMVG